MMRIRFPWVGAGYVGWGGPIVSVPLLIIDLWW
jgi:hypothetical protein